MSESTQIIKSTCSRRLPPPESSIQGRISSPTIPPTAKLVGQIQHLSDCNKNSRHETQCFQMNIDSESSSHLYSLQENYISLRLTLYGIRIADTCEDEAICTFRREREIARNVCCQSSVCLSLSLSVSNLFFFFFFWLNQILSSLNLHDVSAVVLFRMKVMQRW